GRFGTVILFVVFLSCFMFLAWHKPHGTELWAVVTGLVLAGGFVLARTRSPEIKALAESDSHMDMILALAESSERDVHVIFRRPREGGLDPVKRNEVYVSFYTPRQGSIPKLAQNHFRFPSTGRSLYQEIIALLQVVDYELADRKVVVHFGWPMSSWLDRLAIGVMVFNVIRLPKKFPRFDFHIDYRGHAA
ncbi:MAG: hypothetical protein HY914_21325, partial [Desulfomonile tiedjei]|nr:hypothetical protein [Desulfomonile tiedjei]